MNLPLFRPDDDPGPDFYGLARRAGVLAEPPGGDVGKAFEITHGTTVVAIRYADGVLMAGDRRATSGNFISHREIEKVYPADRWSGVAIAGAAGPAMEMVKLFQLQLEHYEKVEGDAAEPRGQGQPARHDGAQPPAGRHAGPGGGARCSPATTSDARSAACSSTTSPAAATRSATTPPPGRAASTPARS